MRIYPILFSQIYCIHKDKVLLLKRKKEPNFDFWVAPGGKIEANESPYECALREFHEETGLYARSIHLRGIVSLVFFAAKTPSIQFIYLVTEFDGTLLPETDEGVLQWHSISSIKNLPMPPEIPLFFSRIIDIDKPIYQAKYVYTSNLRVIRAYEYLPETQIEKPLSAIFARHK